MSRKNSAGKKITLTSDAFSYLDKVEIPKHERDINWAPLLGTVIIITVIAAFGFWFYSLFPHKHNSTTTNAALKATNASVSTPNDSPINSHTSSSLNLSFNFPGSWTVNDKGHGFLTVTSSEVPLIEADGKKVNGIMTMSINSQPSLPAGFTAGTSVAVLDSQLVNYSSPTNNQGAQTYISFVQYSSTNIKGGLDSIFVTGNNGYQKGQIIPAGDMANITPFIFVTFDKCSNKKCSQTIPLTIKSSEWNNNAVKTPILTILTSLTIQ